ncbi:roadblock/LC7 domain-containing protein [Syntrophobacter fumaroxidans]|uniref:Roadblock/LC7 family protein n=1 Tax=Syntrophobacter fumaroxidans (strain DSM 10017 / MPOB) TaxID=335543 RepID=A0LF16_SYNFM|nr:roadblock/LC7 domain-containing protein [Syntrophobacter fumaroxidans]ABK16018.1 Roadblock/LC7 family protein [Syntrophobacter fumaroxidans MPOB]
MSLIVTREQILQLESIVGKELLDAGADHVIIVDMSGNLIMQQGSMHMEDIFSLAALSAANFAATAEIAKLIGEEDFSLLFHKGDKRNIHFSRLGREHIIITLFNESVSLGLIRLKLNRAIEQMASIFKGLEGKNKWPL